MKTILTPFKALSLALQENTTIYTPEECDAWAIRTAKHLAEAKRTIVSIPYKDGERTTLVREKQLWCFESEGGGSGEHAELMLAAASYYLAGNIS